MSAVRDVWAELTWELGLELPPEWGWPRRLEWMRAVRAGRR